jgi:hypothetical protein
MVKVVVVLLPSLGPKGKQLLLLTGPERDVVLEILRLEPVAEHANHRR